MPVANSDDSKGFDPYHRWLGIPRGARPPSYYQLLGISPEETDREVIEEAVIRQTTYLRTYQLGEHAQVCNQLLQEVAQAGRVLLDMTKRNAYDAELQARLSVTSAPSSSKRIPLPRPGWFLYLIIAVSILCLGTLILIRRQDSPPVASTVVKTKKGPETTSEPVASADNQRAEGTQHVREGSPATSTILPPAPAGPATSNTPVSPIPQPSAVTPIEAEPAPTRPAATRPRKPGLDTEGFFLVDGKRVFPIGIWASSTPPLDATLAAGFNWLNVPSWKPEQATKIAPRKTAMVYVNASGLTAERRGANNTAETARLASRIARIASNQHALTCWLGMRRYGKTKQQNLDPGRMPDVAAALGNAGVNLPLMFGSTRPEGFEPLRPWLDVVYAWPEQFLEGEKLPTQTVRLLSWIDELPAGSALVGEVWWRSDQKETIAAETARLARCRAYLALAAGAKGMLFAGMQESQRDALWPDVVRLVQEIRSLERFWLATPIARWRADKVCHVIRRHADQLLIIACNATGRPVRADIPLPPSIVAGDKIQVLGEDRSLRPINGSIRDQFESLQVHLYRIDAP